MFKFFLASIFILIASLPVQADVGKKCTLTGKITAFRKNGYAETKALKSSPVISIETSWEDCYRKAIGLAEEMGTQPEIIQVCGIVRCIDTEGYTSIAWDFDDAAFFTSNGEVTASTSKSVREPQKGSLRYLPNGVKY